MSIEFLSTKFDKASYLMNLLVSHATGKAADSNEYEALRQELLADPEITNLMPPWVRTNRNLDSFWGFIKKKFGTYSERRSYLSEEFTPLLDTLEFSIATKLSMPTSVNTGQDKQPAVARNKRKVFIVHGRDNETKQEVARFVGAIGLEPIILHE